MDGLFLDLLSHLGANRASCVAFGASGVLILKNLRGKPACLSPHHSELNEVVDVLEQKMTPIKKPTAELYSIAKAQIIRDLYDAADKAVREQREAGSHSESARLTFDEINRVIAQARNFGGIRSHQSS
ncbi:hypothetical protein [Roseobacter sp.]|uniref:hypothetical protein n=1 Tax=Roseobacter sp. TaxID=1907202 RepID=UPI0038590A46